MAKRSCKRCGKPGHYAKKCNNPVNDTLHAAKRKAQTEAKKKRRAIKRKERPEAHIAERKAQTDAQKKNRATERKERPEVHIAKRKAQTEAEKKRRAIKRKACPLHVNDAVALFLCLYRQVQFLCHICVAYTCIALLNLACIALLVPRTCDIATLRHCNIAYKFYKFARQSSCCIKGDVAKELELEDKGKGHHTLKNPFEPLAR